MRFLAILALLAALPWTQVEEAEVDVRSFRTLRFEQPVRLLERDGPIRVERLEGGRAYRIEFRSVGPSRLLFRIAEDHRVEWNFTAVPPLPLPLRDPSPPRPSGTAPPPRTGEAPPSDTGRARMVPSSRPVETAVVSPQFGRIPANLLALAAGGREGEDLNRLADLLASADEIDHFRLALELIAREAYPEAVRELRGILERNPRTPLAPLVLLKVGDAEAARAAKAEARARALRGLRLVDEARAKFGEAAGAFTAASAAYQEAHDVQPASPVADDALFGHSEAFRGSTRVGNETATTPARNPNLLVSYLRIIHTMPSSPLADNARFGIAKSEEELGDVLLARGNEAGAREAYENAIREYESIAQIPMASEAPAALWTRATLHDRNLLVRDFAAAVKEYEEYAHSNPALPHATEAGARAAYLRDNYL